MTARNQKGNEEAAVPAGETPFFVVSLFKKGREIPKRALISRIGWKEKLISLFAEHGDCDRWSPIVWRKSERRNSQAFERCDFMVLDVDGTLPLDEAVARIAPYDALFIATKSHGEMKGDSLYPDRYHIVVPFASPVGDLAEFRSSMKAAGEYFPEADRKCLDAARYYRVARRETLHSSPGEGSPFAKTPPSPDEVASAHRHIHGCNEADLVGYNYSEAPIRRIKLPGFGNTIFDVNRPTGGVDTYAKTVRLPIRLSSSGRDGWEWLPSSTPRFELREIDSAGTKKFTRGRFIREDVRRRGLLVLELSPKARAKDFSFLKGTLTKHPQGRRIWIRYEVPRGGAPKEVENHVTELCQTLREAISRRGLADSIIDCRSLSVRPRIPAVPSEIERLMTARVGEPATSASVRRLLNTVMARQAVEMARSVTCAADEASPASDIPYDETRPNDVAARSDGRLPTEVPPSLLKRYWSARVLLQSLFSHPRLFLGAREVDGHLEITSRPLRISGAVMAKRAGRGGQAGERRARRLVDRLVKDGLLAPYSTDYSPRTRARTFIATPALFAEMLQSGVLLGRDGTSLPPFSVENIVVNHNVGNPKTLTDPRDGHFNDWIWAAVWCFFEADKFWHWLSENHGLFVRAKRERERQAQNAWARRVELGALPRNDATAGKI